MSEQNNILTEFYQLMLDGMIAQGIDKAQAGIVATNVIETVQQVMGGHPIYIKKGTYQAIENRNKEICLKFTGHNHHELATAFNLSLKQIYEIVKKDPHKKQLSIFD